MPFTWGDEELPNDALGLVKWLDRHFPPLPDHQVLGKLASEAERLEIAREFGQRKLINSLKTAYKVE